MVELIWDGKYDANGKRTAPPRLKLPFQTVETINESAQQRQMSLDLFSSGRPSEWRNRLIWGDKKYVLPALLDEFAGQVNLIYIDPPFNVGADFSYRVTIPDHPDTEEDETTEFLKQPNIIEQKAYRDTWGRGLDSYLQWFYETTILLSELLTEEGSIYVHVGEGVSYAVRSILNEVLGENNFINEIIWKRADAHADASGYGRIHDIIYLYSKSEKRKWNQQYVPYTEDYIKNQYRYVDENGKRFLSRSLSASGLSGGGYEYEWNGRKGLWRCPKSTMEKYEAEGRLTYTGKGLVRYKQYLEEMPGLPVQSIWDSFTKIHHLANERVDYPTQKPEALLERIINTSSSENDLILDCFCGSGTTAAVAERLNRRWITCDLGRFAIHTTRKRLLSIPDIKPFTVQNLGKYERQAWQAAEFGGEKKAAAMVNQYRRFILDLYNARAIEGYTWLHGIKDGRMVHVGPVDSPISPNDVTQIAIEFKKAMGTGKDAPSVAAVDILGWDFAFELNEIATQQAAQAGIKVKFMRIPREVLESKAVEQGDIKFFELAALSVDVHKKSKEVTLTLKDFVIPPDDVPAEVQKAITHWSQWIDYWAVDWDNKDDTFHNLWQTYRTRQDKTLKLKGSHVYDEAGDYTVMVKVIDILGNDTTKALKVKVS